MTTQDYRRFGADARALPAATGPCTGVILIQTASAPAWDSRCAALDHGQFTADYVARTRPAEVWCWLFCAEYDALDIARILAVAGFPGRLRTRSLALARSTMVRREILRVCPGLRLSMEMARTAQGALHPYEAGVLYPGPVLPRAARPAPDPYDRPAPGHGGPSPAPPA